MARNPYIKVWFNGALLRKFGGTRSKVREMKALYANATYSQLVRMHPKIKHCLSGPTMKAALGNGYNVLWVEYYTPHGRIPKYACRNKLYEEEEIGELFRGVDPGRLNLILNADYADNTVAVFYGLKTFRSDFDVLRRLRDIIRAEHPNVSDTDIDVYQIKHYDARFVDSRICLRFDVPIETIRRHPNDYCAL